MQTQQIDRENPLLETNEIETHNGEIWLKGNYVLISLNLSRKHTKKKNKRINEIFRLGNYLTLDTVKEFLLSIQQQSALTHFNDTLNLSSSTTINSLMDFSGLCRLELKVNISFHNRNIQSDALKN